MKKTTKEHHNQIVQNQCDRKILKAARRGAKRHYIQRNKEKKADIFYQEKMYARRQWDILIDKVLKEKQPSTNNSILSENIF